MDKMIEYTNMAGELRTFETNGKRRAKPTRRTEKKFICQCGHETCLGCVAATWKTKYDGGERVRCCNCGIGNSLRYLSTTVVLTEDAHPQQEQAILKFD